MKYMTVEEAAHKWGVTARSVQIHCQKKLVVHIKIKMKNLNGMTKKTLKYGQLVIK